MRFESPSLRRVLSRSAVADEVEQWVDAFSSDLRMMLQIPAAVEQRVRVERLLVASGEVMLERLLS